jgi:hypothetical protein
MGYIRKKTLRSGKVAAYEIIAKWDREKRQSRSVSTYLGMVDDAGNIVPKGTRKKPHRSKSPAKIAQEQIKEKLILDFGNAYLISELIKRSSIYEPLKFAFETWPEILSLMTYRLCNPGPMYNCQTWLEGTIIPFLSKTPGGTGCFSSQNISRVLSYFGDESIQRQFFENYLKATKIDRASGKKSHR